MIAKQESMIMYKIIDTPITAKLSNGAEITPVATLEDEYGGRAFIWVDDHCYQLGLERHDTTKSGAINETYVQPVTHIFPEAFQVMKTLPDLITA